MKTAAETNTKWQRFKGLFKKTKKNPVKDVGPTAKNTSPIQKNNAVGAVTANVTAPQKGKLGKFISTTKKKAMEKYGEAMAYVEGRHAAAKYAREHKPKVLYTNFLGMYRIEYSKLAKPSGGDPQMYLVVVSSNTTVNLEFGSMITALDTLTGNSELGSEYTTFFYPGTSDGNRSDYKGNYVINGRAHVTQNNIDTMKKLFKKAQEYYDTNPEARRKLRDARGIVQTKLGKLASVAGNKFRTAKAGVVADYQKTKKRIMNKYEKVVSKVEFKRKLDNALGDIRKGLLLTFDSNPTGANDAVNGLRKGFTDLMNSGPPSLEWNDTEGEVEHRSSPTNEYLKILHPDTGIYQEVPRSFSNITKVNSPPPPKKTE